MTDWHPAWLWLQMLGYWQTLVAGFLAVLAAWLTIRATKDAADREIEAANRQISTAQKQIDITLRLDRRRAIQEAHAFFLALKSAVSVVIESAREARAMVPSGGGQGSGSEAAYQARQHVLCLLFPDLRPACVRLGGDLTALFVRLDQDISDFAAQWRPALSPAGLAFRIGVIPDFHDDLDNIEEQARSLLAGAQQHIEQCQQELRALAETPEGEHP